MVLSLARSQVAGLTHLKMGEGVEPSQALTTQIYAWDRDKVNGRNNISTGINVLAINFIIKRVAKPVQFRSGLLIKLMAGTTFLMESMFPRSFGQCLQYTNQTLKTGNVQPPLPKRHVSLLHCLVQLVLL